MGTAVCLTVGGIFEQILEGKETTTDAEIRGGKASDTGNWRKRCHQERQSLEEGIMLGKVEGHQTQRK